MTNSNERIMKETLAKIKKCEKHRRKLEKQQPHGWQYHHDWLMLQLADSAVLISRILSDPDGWYGW